MKLLGILLLGRLSSGIACPKGWTQEGKSCYKFLNGEFGIFKAREKCKELGSTVFLPKTLDDLKAVGKHKNIEGYVPSEDNFWLPLKVEDLNKRSFPPNVVLPNRRPAPDVFNSELSISIGAEMTSMWTKKAKKAIQTGQARQRRMAFLFYKRGRISLDVFRKPHGVMCKQNKLKSSIPDEKRKECWQPESTEYDAIKYTGRQNVSSLGFECEKWNDEEFQSHRYKPLKANHNYCRDPSGLNGKPWCYVKKKLQWDYCPVNYCHDVSDSSETENSNELYPFLYDQFQCGKNERMLREINSTPRGEFKIAGGRNLKVGQAPYMARLRYTSKMNFGGSLPPFHKCGATLISSCWAITAARCFLDPDEIENDIAGEDIQQKVNRMRINVGTRFDHEFADDSENEKYCDKQDSKYDYDLCQDFQGHQTLKINKFIIHKNYRKVHGILYNDIALIQLKPTNSEGECAIPGPTVQYACLNPDDNKFSIGEICEVSGWGDTEGQSGHIFNFAKQLQSGFVKIQSFNDCAAKYGGGIEENIHLCAYDDKVDAMAGDDGGPLTCFDRNNHAYLTGIISFGDDVKTDRPGVYVPISKYYKWITQTIAHQDIPEFTLSNTCKNALCFY